jgi:hypothetical protein
MPCRGVPVIRRPPANIQQLHVIADFLEDSFNKMEAGERVKDFRHYVYEVALEAVYGPGIWNYVADLPEGVDE